jgi:hypothetical protein
MPIVVRHDAPAAVIGSAAMAQGAEERRRREQEIALKTAMAQQQAELEARAQNISRMNAIGAAAAQYQTAAMNAQERYAQNQQDNEAAIYNRFMQGQQQAQQIAQDAALKQQMQQALFGQQKELSTQNAGEQLAYMEAQKQAQMKMADVEARWKMLDDPIGDFTKQQQAWKQQGMQFSPEQEKQSGIITGKLRKIQSDLQTGGLTRVDAMNAMAPLHKQLMTMQPDGKAPTLAERYAKEVYEAPDGGKWTPNKDGKLVLEQPPAKPEKAATPDKTDHELAYLKRRGAWEDNETKRNKRITELITSKSDSINEQKKMGTFPPNMMVNDAMIRSELEKMYPPEPPPTREAPEPGPGAAPVAPSPLGDRPAPVAGGAPPAGGVPPPSAPPKPPALPDYTTFSKAVTENTRIPPAEHPVLYGMIARQPEHASEITQIASMKSVLGKNLRAWDPADLVALKQLIQKAPEAAELFTEMP